jgi:hypothetical protein
MARLSFLVSFGNFEFCYSVFYFHSFWEDSSEEGDRSLVHVFPESFIIGCGLWKGRRVTSWKRRVVDE